MGLGADLVAIVVLAVKLVATAFHGVSSMVQAPPPAVAPVESVAEPARPDAPPGDALDEASTYL